MDYLPELKDKKVNVITMDGRCIVGILKGSDSVCNLVLQDTEERIFSTDKGMEVQPLGLYIVRGDSVAMIGEVDEELDNSIDWNAVHGITPKQIVHTVV